MKDLRRIHTAEPHVPLNTLRRAILYEGFDAIAGGVRPLTHNLLKCLWKWEGGKEIELHGIRVHARRMYAPSSVSRSL